ncbi:MAG: hypothetical protein AAFQ59_11385 [Pseudomonadota bacterium]
MTMHDRQLYEHADRIMVESHQVVIDSRKLNTMAQQQLANSKSSAIRFFQGNQFVQTKLAEIREALAA